VGDRVNRGLTTNFRIRYNRDMKGDNLTLKQRKWMKIYLDCGNATEAAMQIYDCKDRDSARNIGYENLSKLDYTEFLEEGGITDDLLKRKIAEGLDATKIKTSLTEPDKIENDFAIRHKYLETALKLKQRLIDRADLTSNGETIKIDASSMLEKVYGKDK